MRRMFETAVMTTALVVATAWSAGPVAARIADGLASGNTRATIDRTRLPLGDGKLSREPMIGSLWSCQEQFNGRGAFAEGPWMRGDGTFDITAKPLVDGDVAWPHQLTIELSGETRTVAGNGLPNHTTGVYPIAREDDAYQYDRNPNTITAQSLQLPLPAMPTLAAEASCVPGGPIGVLLTGSVVFNAVDAEGRDAVAHEIQDRCEGHPERDGNYHYHSLTECLDIGTADTHSPLVGYAFDGFGIYGHHGEAGAALSNDDLDACHGHTHAIEWDGQPVEMFHYHATQEYPYTIGCFRGQALQTRPGNPGGGPPGGSPPGGPGPGGPPPGGPPPGGPTQLQPPGQSPAGRGPLLPAGEPAVGNRGPRLGGPGPAAGAGGPPPGGPPPGRGHVPPPPPR